MSAYSFISTNYEIPEVKNSKEKVITVKAAIELGIKAHEFMPWENMNPNEMILFFEKESDLDELVIKKDNTYEKNVRWYTDKTYIYTVHFDYSESRAMQLLEYLKENIREGHQLELWSIWLDEKRSVKPIICNIEKNYIKYLKQMYDRNYNGFLYHSCMILKR